jgi:Fic family protein
MDPAMPSRRTQRDTANIRQALPEPLLAFDSGSAVVSDALARVESLKARYAAEQRGGRVLPNAVEAVRIELTYHSNAIEGSTLTLRDTQLVIEGRAPQGGKPLREIYEARNHDRALRAIEQWVADHPVGRPLSERDLLDVHGMVLADIDPAAAVRLRSARVLIAGARFVPPGSHKFGELIPGMLQLANRPGIHPVVQAAELHYNLVAVHPFSDGNGRTARLIMNYQLLQQGFPLTIIDVAERAEYLEALDEANAGRPERFTLFVASSVERSTRKLVGE